jgi:pyruvate/2-oxoglutarate dehydrogenase complex dihydrolipoamide acyltransferase (E2) component
MPQLGMGMIEGTIVSWLVSDGAIVKRGEPIIEFETDKVTNTIESPANGVLQRVAAEQTTVPVRDLLGYVLAEGEPAVKVTARVGPAEGMTLSTRRFAPASASPLAGEVRPTPIARRLAAEHDIDLATVVGSGPGGRIVEADVRAAIERAQIGPLPSEPEVARRIPLIGRRKVIAERMMASLADAAQLTIIREVEAGELVQVRRSLLERADAIGVRVSYDALLVKALATALADHPALNAVIESDEILLLGEVHVAVAIADEKGLIAPVVRDAQSRALIEIAQDIDDFAARAAQGMLLPDELVGGTVTITNLGMYGIDIFTPILNPPQSAILGIGRISPRPFVIADKLTVRPTVHLSLTWDHRVADGAQAALLLDRIAELIGDRTYLTSLF